MRRIPRIRQPSAALTQCLQTSASVPVHTAACRATAASCLARPRDLSTTPHRTFHSSRPWADKTRPEAAADETTAASKAAAETSQPGSQEETFLSPEEAEDPFAAIQAESSSRHNRHAASAATIRTDLVLPPSDKEVAPRADDLDAEAEHYKPADTAAGLEVVGGLEGWFSEKKKKEKDHWGPSKAFVGFAAAKKVASPALLELCVRRAVLEALAAAAAGTQEGGDQLLTRAWRRDAGRKGLMRVLGLTAEVDAQGVAVVKGDVSSVVDGLKDDKKTGAVKKEEIDIPLAEAKEIIQSWDQNWKRISLEDVKLRFAITKRIFQLTGHTIPDAKLLHIDTVGQLLAVLVKPPAPRTVQQAIEQRGDLTKLPNVKVHSRRQTPVHEAKRVGRWKVIEQELEKRGLPVLGNGDVDKFREHEWFRGPQPDPKDKKKRR